MADEIAGPNYEIRRRNFQGSLPIQITIDDSSSMNNDDDQNISNTATKMGGFYSDKEIPTYYVMQPRMSFLFLLTPQLNDFYSEFLDLYAPNKDDLWYSYKNEPLRFDIPIGILYDTLIHKDAVKNEGYSTTAKP